MSYRIITDTCCDFPSDVYAELNISAVALKLDFQGKTVSEYPEAFLKEFVTGMRNGATGQTSAANPEDWKAVMEPWLQKKQDLLVLTFSSGLSTTYQSAVIAAEELREAYPGRTIHVVDTLCASRGQGLLVWYACKKRDEGMSLDELAAWCQEYRYKLCHWFTVNDLMHLKRGGRVSAATAIAGTLLQIKPILHVDNEGHLINVGKVRGRKASIHALADKVAEDAIDPETQTMFISHGDCPEDAEYLASLLKEKLHVPEIHINHVGPVIGSHSGPGTLAMFFVGKKR